MGLQQRVGRLVRQRREAMGLSQEQFGERAGLHRNFIGMIERAERGVTLATLEKLVPALDLTLSEFFAELEEEADRTPTPLALRFGRLIATIRREQGLSQEELGERAGMHRTYIGMIEGAEKRIRLEAAERLARALDLKLWELCQRLDTEELEAEAEASER